MKKITTAVFFVIVILNAGYTQDMNKQAQFHEYILHGLDTARHDTTRVLFIAELANFYKSDSPDSALFYGYKALALARQIQFPTGELRAFENMIIALNTLGKRFKSIRNGSPGFKNCRKKQPYLGQSIASCCAGYHL